MLCKICTSTSVTMYTQKVKGYTLRANIYKNRKLKKPNDFMICKFLAGVSRCQTVPCRSK